MSFTSAVIETLRKVGNPNIAVYPKTVTNAVYDDTAKLNQSDINKSMILFDDIAEVGQPIPTDADTLQGHPATYFSVNAESVKADIISTPQSVLTEVNADKLQGHDSNYFATKSELTSSIYNPNLLDNPWFANPINQRGKTSYANITQHTYCIDRWYSWTPWGSVPTNVTLESDGLLIQCNPISSVPNATGIITQSIEDYKAYRNKEITFSIDVIAFTQSDTGANPQLVIVDTFDSSILAHLEITAIGVNSLTLNVGNVNGLGVGILVGAGASTSASIKVSKCKLELGSISTLHLDPPPNPQVELAKCQRYLQEITRARFTHLCTLHKGIDENTSYGAINLPNSMRITPTLITGTFYAFNTGAQIECTIIILPYIQNNGISIAATPKEGQQGFTKDTYMLCSNSEIPILLSAEL